MLRMFGGIALASCALLLLPAAPVHAQDQLLEEVYGQGVHAFFAGRYNEAFDTLTVAVDGGTKDPRVYYFRALTDAKLGRDSMAESDMRTGAQLETEDTEQLYPVSRSLERIQGRARLTIERHRMVARAETRERQEKLNALRYEQQRRSEESVRRTPVAPPPEPEPPTKGDAAPPKKAAPPKADDPFGAAPEKGAAEAPTAGGEAGDPFDAQPVTPVKKAEGEESEPAAGGDAPAEGEPPAAAKADDSDAFGGGDAGEMKEPDAAGGETKAEEGAPDAAGGGAEMPAEEPAEKKDAPAAKGGDDPFGDAAPAKKPATATPKPPKPGDAGDPFGDDKDQPAPKKAAAAAKAPAKAPAKKGDDDPFGE